MKEITVALYQMDIQSAKKEENLEKVKKILQENHRKEIDLWVLPEMFSTGFSYSHFPNLAEELENSSTINKLQILAKELGTNIAGTFLVKEKKRGSFSNVGFILDPSKGLIYDYKKIHLWGNEKQYFIPGKELVKPISINNKAKVGLSICYDLRFPEVARTLALQGADILITVANWPRARINHFELLASARALENTVYHIAVNRVGFDIEPTLTKYSGSSRIIDPLGEIIAGAGNFERTIKAQLEPYLLEHARKLIPVMNDRRLTIK